MLKDGLKAMETEMEMEIGAPRGAVGRAEPGGVLRGGSCCREREVLAGRDRVVVFADRDRAVGVIVLLLESRRVLA
jgi:hypothetical protein